MPEAIGIVLALIEVSFIFGIGYVLRQDKHKSSINNQFNGFNRISIFDKAKSYVELLLGNHSSDDQKPLLTTSDGCPSYNSVIYNDDDSKNDDKLDSKDNKIYHNGNNNSFNSNGIQNNNSSSNGGFNERCDAYTDSANDRNYNTTYNCTYARPSRLKAGARTYNNRVSDKSKPNIFKNIDVISYYWFILTIVTGFLWETTFVTAYKEVNQYSEHFIHSNSTVWTSYYTIDYLLPWKFSKIFYGDYGAYADREYMLGGNDWSRFIESSHAIGAGLFAFLALLFKFLSSPNRKNNDINVLMANENRYLICVGVSMGTQVMNSILYMVEYMNQTHDPDNVNYANSTFPAGILLYKRPFMWVNIFWTILPTYVIIIYLLFPNRIRRFQYKRSKSVTELHDLSELSGSNINLNEIVEELNRRKQNEEIENKKFNQDLANYLQYCKSST